VIFIAGRPQQAAEPLGHCHGIKASNSEDQQAQAGSKENKIITLVVFQDV